MSRRKVSTTAARIRSARKAAGMTQKAVATAYGCDRCQITQWESGRREPTTASLRKLATAIGCDLITLTGT